MDIQEETVGHHDIPRLHTANPAAHAGHDRVRHFKKARQAPITHYDIVPFYHIRFGSATEISI